MVPIGVGLGSSWHNDRMTGKRPRPLVYGHRGASAHARGNTVEAFALAIEHGADGVELDVRSTRDGALIVHHDDRPSADAAPFVIQDLAAIKAASPWVATLDEAWQALGPSALLNLEIKNEIGQADFDQSRRLSKEVVRWIERNEAASRTLVSSFDGISLAAVGKAEPGIETGLLTTAAVDPLVAIEWANRGGHVSVHLPASVVLEDAQGIVAAADPLRVLVWTVNDPATAVTLAEAGVAGLFSDDPGLIVATLSG